MLGWEASLEDWNDTLRQSATTPFVVQERVSSVTRDFPSIIDGESISAAATSMLILRLLCRTVYGCMTRLRRYRC